MLSTFCFSLQPSSPPITTCRELGELIVFIFHSSFSTKICSCIITMPLRLQTMDRSIVNPFAPKEVKQTFVTIVPSCPMYSKVDPSCQKYSKVAPSIQKFSKVFKRCPNLPKVFKSSPKLPQVFKIYIWPSQILNSRDFADHPNPFTEPAGFRGVYYVPSPQFINADPLLHHFSI